MLVRITAVLPLPLDSAVPPGCVRNRSWLVAKWRVWRVPSPESPDRHFAVYDNLSGTSEIIRCLNRMAPNRYADARPTVLTSEEEKCRMNPLISIPAGCFGWLL